MRFIITNLLTAVLLIQFSSLRAFGVVDENNVICHDCIDKNAKEGSTVEVGGRTWVLDKLHDPEGTPMWEAHPVFDRGGVPFDHEPPGSERLTGRDLTGFEDSDKLNREEREKLHRIQEKIVSRLNAETVADAGATSTELEKQVGYLNQAIQNAGEASNPGSNGQMPSTDPVFSLYDTIQGKNPGRGFSPEQAGWQMHDDHDYQSDHKDELNKLRDRLNDHQSQTPQQEDAKRIGYSVLGEADNAYKQNDQELGNSLLEAGKVIVDIATDMIPITSTPKDFYRAFVGKDPMTGASLANWERVVAGGFFVAGIVTLGGSNAGKPWVRAIAKFVRSSEPEIAAVANSAKKPSLLREAKNLADKIRNKLDNVKILDPVKENAKLFAERGYTQLAWDEGKVIYEGNIKGEQKFVRFFSEGKTDQVGFWIADPTDLVGKTPAEIKQALGIEHMPTSYAPVNLSHGPEVIGGFPAKNEWGGGSGIPQYFIKDPKPANFGAGSNIGEIFRGIK